MTATIEPAATPGEQPGIPFEEPIFGRSALINLGGCDPEIIRSPDDIRHWVDELINKIKMEAYGEPNMVRFGEGDLYGDTHVQLITTSHIVVHTVHVTRCTYIDLFSCATFAADLVKDQACAFFGAQASELGYFERRDPTKGTS